MLRHQKIGALLVGLLIVSAPLARSGARETRMSVPFELLVVEPGEGATAGPVTSHSSGALDFPADIPVRWHNEEGLASAYGDGQFLPIHDRRLTSFPLNELRQYQIYASRSVYTLSGEGHLHFYIREDCSNGIRPCLEPGVYTVNGRKGPEYNSVDLDLAIIDIGSEYAYEVDMDHDGLADSNTLRFVMARTVDSPDYFKFNSHEHASEWERMPKEARVLRNLAYGGEVWFHTAHLSLNYYEKTLEDMGLNLENVCVTSNEDPVLYVHGHIIVAPQYAFAVDPELFGINHAEDPALVCDPYCALDSTTCQRYCPDRGRHWYGKDEYWTSKVWGLRRSPFKFIRQRDLYREKTGRPVIFIAAHPDAPGGFNGYLDGMIDDEGKVIENDDALPFWRDDFDVLEFRHDQYAPNRLGAYYSLLNQGYTFALTCGNDEHFLNMGGIGHCAYVHSPMSPSDNDRQGFVDSVIENLARGRSFVSFGPYLTAGVKNPAGDLVVPDALLGSTVDATAGSAYADGSTVTFHLEAQNSWPCPAQYISAVVNGQTVVAGDTVDWVETMVLGGHTACRAEADYPLSFSRDSWVIFMTGIKDIADGQGVDAILNPIRVERDGLPGMTPLIKRPVIENLEALVGSTPVDELNPALPGDTVILSFDVMPADTVDLVQAWVTSAAYLVKYTAHAKAGLATCSESPPGSLHYNCYYKLTGEWPEQDGPENEIRVSARDVNGYRGWAYDSLDIKFPDANSDGLPDWYEDGHGLTALGCGDSADDCDGDGLSNIEEFNLGDREVFTRQAERLDWALGWTDPAAADTDGDGVGDIVEAAAGSCLDPREFDTDKDGLCDGDTRITGAFWYSGGVEYEKPFDFLPAGQACIAGEDLDLDGNIAPGETDPCDPDTDGDGIPDGWEYFHLHYGHGDTCATNPLAGDSQADPDGDGIVNIREYFWLTDPCSPDTDGDGVGDLREIAVHGSDPEDQDTDKDSMTDGYEDICGLVLTLDDIARDADGDGISNLDEFNLGSRADKTDSDDDGMPDGYELDHAACGVDIVVPDSAGDADADALQNLAEMAIGTNPCLPDTDGDSVSDYDEVALDGHGGAYDPMADMDPLDPDTDGDGMGDYFEFSRIACGLDPLAADTSGDPDADGLSNIAEMNISTNPCDDDSDGDAMPDGYEVSNLLDPTADDSLGDADSDGMQNIDEHNTGTDPNDPDSDGDGLIDGWEFAYSACGLDPLLAGDTTLDPDGDGLTNMDENINGTDPCDIDTEDDGMSDDYEVTHGLDPLSDDTGLDLDGDGLANLVEFSFGTDPNNVDTDGDGLGDGWETTYSYCGVDPLHADSAGDADGDNLDDIAEYAAGTDPCDTDTDDDTMPDEYEAVHGLDPLADDTGLDLDGDGLSNIQEFALGTAPDDIDTENDGMPDGWEQSHSGCGLDPLADDSAGDPDADLLGNLGEHTRSTDPCADDTDGDGMPDGFEAENGLDPLLDDTSLDLDGDGLTNILEHELGSEPDLADTDGDGMDDGWEQNHSSCGLDLLAGDSAADPDADLLGNLGEYGHSTDPCAADTDGDQVGDFVETIVKTCMDPLEPDTDGDGLADGSPTGEDKDGNGELGPGESDPCLVDTDGDGSDDHEETTAAGTDPALWDTDGDYIPDPFETLRSGDGLYPLDPLDPSDGPLDHDGDGNSSRDEYWNGSDYRAPDPAPDPLYNPACYYWGDANGDGVAGPGDIVPLKIEVSGGSHDLSPVLPPGGASLDIDNDGVLGPGDVSCLQIMINNANRSGGYPSTPSALLLADGPPATVSNGSTASATVSVVNQYGALGFSPSFAVVFWVDEAASTGSAAIVGGDGEDLAEAPGNRYDISASAREAGVARVVIVAESPGEVVVRVAIPACGSEPLGRWASRVTGPAISFQVE